MFIFINLFSNDSKHILDKLNSPMPNIPLKKALGDKVYNDAIGSGKFRFVSNSKCRPCHKSFFIGRKKDPHDHAMKNIISTKYEKNPRCLTCHSTGYRTKSGFVDMKRTPRLANIQCEGCHGPGNVHIDMVKEKLRDKENFIEGGFLAGQDNPQVLKKICLSCHTKRWNKQYHDLDREYNSYKKANPNLR